MFWKTNAIAVTILSLAVRTLGAELASQPALRPAEETVRREAPQDDVIEPKPLSGLDRWSFQVGVAYITGSTIDEIAGVNGEWANGPSAGQIYLLQASYKVTTVRPELFGRRFDIDVELPLVLGVVDEHGSDLFMQYSAGVTLRWKTFPWNRWLYTNLETGVGLTYSGHVLLTERERHPNRDRSHLEFYWPVQIMLAHPRHREHQLVLLLHHHSGGTIFHTGGANSLGIGYRFVPAER